MDDEWFVPRAELEAMHWEWIPDTCPVLASIVDEIVRDTTATGIKVEKC